MLVLTRKVGQTLIIGGLVQVKVLAVHGTQIRLGVEAPKEVAVDRAEVHTRRQAEPYQPVRVE